MLTFFLYFAFIIGGFVTTSELKCECNKNESTIITTSSPFQLPKTIMPTKYSIWLYIDLDQSIINGNVSIKINVIEMTKNISINTKNLNINLENISLENLDNNNFVVYKSVHKQKKYEIFDIIYEENLLIGNYQLNLNFDGLIQSNFSYGLYKNEYQIDNKIFYLAATDLAGTYARTIFPCWDEPEFKANFQINIYHHEKYEALSNMPVILINNTTQYDHFKLTRFEETIKMSTYLLDIIILNNFIKSSGDVNDTALIQIYSPKNESYRTEYTSKLALKSLKNIESWLNITFPLSKLDFVTGPNLKTTIENYGLAMIKEPFIYRDNDDIYKIPIQLQQLGTIKIIQEITYMFFANQPTTESWEYAWINRGLSTYLEHLILDLLEPTWQIKDQYFINHFQASMQLEIDYLLTRPMTLKLNSLQDINNMFDYRIYSKAASIFRMFSHVIGEQLFQQIIREYIVERSFISTNITNNSDYLFSIIQKYVDQNVEQIKLPATVKVIFESWTNNSGYPIISFSRDYQHSTAFIKQKQFVLPTQYKEINMYVPISMTDAKNNMEFKETKPTIWKKPIDTYTDINISNQLSQNDWIILNVQSTGYFRVSYDMASWDLICQELNSINFENIHPINRAQLISDVINLEKYIEHVCLLTFSLLSYLHREKHYLPWAALAIEYEYLERPLRSMKYYNRFERFMQNLTSLAYLDVRINIKERNHLLRMHRRNVAKLACLSGLKLCINDSNELVKNMLNNFIPIIEEIEDFVLCGNVRYNNKYQNELLDYGLKLYSKDINKALVIFNGLGCSRNETFIQKYLEMTITDNLLEPTHRNMIFQSLITGGFIGTRSAIEFLYNNFDNITSRYETVADIFNNNFAINIVSNQLLEMFNKFVEKHSTKFDNETNKAINILNGTVNENLYGLEYNNDFAKYWFKENIHNDDTTDAIPSNLFVRFFSMLWFFF